MLCDLSAGFDIRDLLLLSEAQEAKPITIALGNVRAYPAMPDYYKHHHGSSALRESSFNGCNLCTFFWQDRENSYAPNSPGDTAMGTELVEEQICIGPSSWTGSRQRLPYMTIVQLGTHGRAD